MNKAKGGIAAIVIGVIISLAGALFVFAGIFSGSSHLTEYTGAISSDPYDIYDLGSVLVVDKYGYIEGGSDLDEDYYIIGFTTQGSEDMYIGSLLVDETADIYEMLDDYSEDDSMYIGDLYIDLCASADTTAELDRDIYRFYKETAEDYKDILPEFTDSGISFTYYCRGAQAFPSALKEEKSFNGIMTAICAVFLAAGIAVFAAGVSKTLKANKAAQTAQPGVYYNPQINTQGNYYPQTGPVQYGGPNNVPQQNYQYAPPPGSQNSSPQADGKNIYYTPPGENHSNNYNDGNQIPPDGGIDNQNG